jgi:hypothetical protein
MCGELVCAETEYKAEGITVVSSTPNPNANPCNTDSKKKLAEETAKDQLKTAVANQGEKIDSCDGDARCVCGDMPAWPATGGWKKINTGLQSSQDVTFGTTCTWTVVLKYDRHYRKRSADCYQKPVAMRHVEADETLAARV